jgi:hypothetical protein
VVILELSESGGIKKYYPDTEDNIIMCKEMCLAYKRGLDYIY